jgi:hypothetical protein
MSVLDRLANALGRNDERPNVELAAALARDGDAVDIAVLADALSTKPQAVQNDAIKALTKSARSGPTSSARTPMRCSRR